MKSWQFKAKVYWKEYCLVTIFSLLPDTAKPSGVVWPPQCVSAQASNPLLWALCISTACSLATSCLCLEPYFWHFHHLLKCILLLFLVLVHCSKWGVMEPDYYHRGRTDWHTCLHTAGWGTGNYVSQLLILWFPLHFIFVTIRQFLPTKAYTVWLWAEELYGMSSLCHLFMLLFLGSSQWN